MKIILAQGNPGPDYAQTRHNVGWLLLDMVADGLGAEFALQKKFAAHVATASIAGEKVLLVKPTTFYNETGRAGRALVDFYKLDPAQDVLVIHDDIALPLGTVRVRPQGSDAGNNGIKSLNAHLGPSYWRLRVGIWSPHREREHAAAFVLGRLSADETAVVRGERAPYVRAQVEAFARGALAAHSSATVPKNDA